MAAIDSGLGYNYDNFNPFLANLQEYNLIIIVVRNLEHKNLFQKIELRIRYFTVYLLVLKLQQI